MRPTQIRCDAPGPEGDLICSGVLVSAQVVLTAAHCIGQGDRRQGPSAAVFAPAEPDGDADTVPVLRAVTHPHYDSAQGEADLALLRLTRQPLVNGVVELADFMPAKEADVLFSGIDTNGFDGSYTRHLGGAQLLAVDSQRLIYRPGTCPGDSGGALFMEHEHRPHQVGVVSRGIQCDLGIATPVVTYLPWIQTQIEALNASVCHDGNGDCASACADPDCLCTDGGACSPCASTDPDCADACGADGVCASSCDVPDVDCSPPAADPPCSDDNACLSTLKRPRGCAVIPAALPAKWPMAGVLLVLVACQRSRRRRSVLVSRGGTTPS